MINMEQWHLHAVLLDPTGSISHFSGLTYLHNSMLSDGLVHAAIIANMPCKRAAKTLKEGEAVSA
jgi:hypothetical protein